MTQLRWYQFKNIRNSLGHLKLLVSKSTQSQLKNCELISKYLSVEQCSFQNSQFTILPKLLFFSRKRSDPNIEKLTELAKTRRDSHQIFDTHYPSHVTAVVEAIRHGRSL